MIPPVAKVSSQENLPCLVYGILRLSRPGSTICGQVQPLYRVERVEGRASFCTVDEDCYESFSCKISRKMPTAIWFQLPGLSVWPDHLSIVNTYLYFTKERSLLTDLISIKTHFRKFRSFRYSLNNLYNASSSTAPRMKVSLWLPVNRLTRNSLRSCCKVKFCYTLVLNYAPASVKGEQSVIRIIICKIEIAACFPVNPSWCITILAPGR